MATRPEMKPAVSPAPIEPVSGFAHPLRREWAVIGLLTLIGAGFRFRGFGQLGLTHFDEGVYAISGLWSIMPTGLTSLDPQVIAYAPAGYPVLIGVAYLVFGVVDTAAIFVSALCGVLTIPVAGWLGLRTIGPGAGAAAAGFAAFSSAHIAFSRKALTDAPFLLTWLIALALGGRFLESPRLGRALTFGLAVGLAQNVKYNGWIVGGIIILAALLGLLVDPRNRGRGAILRTFGLGALAALTAALIYFPWYVFVERHGGYADLMRHHRSYLGGTSTWLPHLWQQLAQVVALSGGTRWSAITWTMAWLASAVAVMGGGFVKPARRWEGIRPVLGFFLGLAMLAIIPDAGWWMGLAWAGWLMFDRAPARRVLGTWWLVLSVMTPFYHPYARLWLPIEAAGWLVLAELVVGLGSLSKSVRLEPGLGALPLPRGIIVRGGVTALCLLVAREHWGTNPPRPFPAAVFETRTDGLRLAVSDLAHSHRFPSDSGITLRVLGRRPLMFYLAQSGVGRVGLLPDAKSLQERPEPGGDWVIVDEAIYPKLLRPVVFAGTVPYWADADRQVAQSEKPLTGFWQPVEVFGGARQNLDPVTLLDIAPEAVYPQFDLDARSARLILLAPRDAKIRRFRDE
jgi:dolichyl-phosphate-mannose-protein mannosyltransferase